MIDTLHGSISKGDYPITPSNCPQIKLRCFIVVIRYVPESSAGKHKKLYNIQVYLY